MVSLEQLLAISMFTVLVDDEEKVDWRRVPGGWVLYDYDERSFKDKAGKWQKRVSLATAVFIPEPVGPNVTHIITDTAPTGPLTPAPDEEPPPFS